MRLSDGEKLILTMLCDLYRGESKREIDPDFVNRTISSGETWALHWKYPHIPFEREATPPLVDEVSDILAMWWLIESSYDKLGPADKKQLEDAVGPGGKDPKFPGFYGNSEREHLSIARVLINDLDKYTNLKGRGDRLDSHWPIIDVHRRMLSVFSPMRNALGNGELNVGQLIEILKAAEPGHGRAMIDFNALVVSPAMDAFAESIIIDPQASQPGAMP